MTIPGVQKPHCIASASMNACCTGWSSSPLASPSMVVTGRPTASRANVVHAHTGVPSSHTVHAEHEPRSHPTFVP